MKLSKNIALVLAPTAVLLAAPAFGQQAADPAQAAPAQDAQPNPVVGGAEMLPTKNIVENASASADHTALVSALKAAGLDQTLSGPGPFTVFAPDNDAFSRLAPGTMETLLKPENKASLVKILNYHVVPGALTLETLLAQAKASGGSVTLTTVEGSPLTLTAEDSGAVKLTDANGNPSYISQPDVKQSNGVVHVVNGVLLPKLG